MERAAGRRTPGRAGRARSQRRTRQGKARGAAPRAAPRRAGGARADGHRAPVLPPGTGAAGGHCGADDGDNRHGVRQVNVLQPAHAAHPLRAGTRASAVPVSDQGARTGPSAGAERIRAGQARAPGHLRRRHAARGAQGHPQERQRRAHQPRHAAHGHPPQPRSLDGAVLQPGRGGDRRGARLPRRIRLARRQRAQAAAEDRRRLRHPARSSC